MAMRIGALLVCLAVGALASPASGQVLYGADQFGSVDLVPRQATSTSGLIESLGARVDRFEPIADFPPDDPIRVLGKAVGRLDILMTGSDGVRGVANCTATLIDRDKILTNHHCVPGPHGAVIERVLVRFGYLELGSTTSRSFQVDTEPIEASRALDYAVLKVAGDPAEAFGIAPLKVRSARTNERLFIVHHPAGQPQRLTRAFCRAHPKVAVDKSALRHQCDTLPGSSGSLIFAQRDNALVALHNLGGLVAGDTLSFNRGIDAVALKGGSARFAALCCGPPPTAPAAKAAEPATPPKVVSAAPPPKAPAPAPAKPAEPAAAVSPAPSSPRCDGVEALVGSERRCLEPKDTFKDCPECPEMVVIPAGKFMMGSPSGFDEYSARIAKGAYANEMPQHEVTISKPFALGKFEITFAEWDACIRDKVCLEKEDQGWGRDRRPVINVSSSDIDTFYLPWLNRKTGKTYRLPTEAEWEYAARGGLAVPYAFGYGFEITKEQAQFSEGSEGSAGKTVTVGSFMPNAFGLFDTHGNVWEWVQDCYKENYRDAPSDGQAPVTCNSLEGVIRGGSWRDLPRNLRFASRLPVSRGARGDSLGFRVARTLAP
jgi:formylglycine-generating enzyme required for sulfatase activity